MNTLEFLRLVLPDEGVHYLVCFTKDINPKTNRPYTHHKYFLTLEEMADAVPYWDNNDKYVAVYHACASYLKPYVEVEGKDGEPWKQYRVDENWDRAKAFWIDIDCGQKKHDEGKGYLTKGDAYKAIGAFCKQIGWPIPLVIDSGNGLHCYWPLTKAITHQKWKAVATALKSALAHCHVIADPSRTSDFASILRPVGSLNKKGDALEVKARNTAQECDPAELAANLNAFITDNAVALIKESKKPTNRGAALNADLLAHLPQYPEIDSSIELIASRCQQLGHMRDTQGDVGYETWRGIIGLASFCVDGDEKMDEWNARRLEKHDQDDWQSKKDTWKSGPTTCHFFEQHDCDKCVGCEHKGKVTSPIVLGRIIPINKESVAEIIDEDGETTELEVPAILSGYTWSNGVMARLLPDKDGVLQAFPFCHSHFYLTSRIRTEDGTYRIGVRMHLPNKKIRDFDMSTESMASSTDMLRSLSRYELTRSNHKGSGEHMAAYLHDQLQDLMRRVDEMNTLTHFGWVADDNSFLLGDRMYHPDGTVRKVLVGGNAAKFVSAMPKPKGSIAKYADAINFMYDRAGAQHWQYALCSGWGSILTPFCEDTYKGLMFALQGGDSGKGKTTVCYASMYAFGNAEKLTLKSKDGFTYNALWAFLGTFKNLPVLVDELTNMDASAFSDAAYGVSRGEEKIRLSSAGGKVGFTDLATWRLSPYITGNRDFHGLLATTQANSQAEAVRLIQINVDRYPVVKLAASPEEEVELVQAAVDTMRVNSGVAGEAIVRYVVHNAEAIRTEVREMTHVLAGDLPGSKFRFYRSHAACSLVMARISKDLGVHNFDLVELRKFAVSLLCQLAEDVNITNTVTLDDAFNLMVNELAPRLIVTTEFRDVRDGRGAETPRNRVNGSLAGRYITGTQSNKTHAGHLIIIQKELRDWCNRNRIDANALVRKLEESKAVVKKGGRMTITRGTDYPYIQQSVYIFDTTKLGDSALSPVLQPNAGELVDVA